MSLPLMGADKKPLTNEESAKAIDGSDSQITQEANRQTHQGGLSRGDGALLDWHQNNRHRPQ
jgi:hypothetical protein